MKPYLIHFLQINKKLMSKIDYVINKFYLLLADLKHASFFYFAFKITMGTYLNYCIYFFLAIDLG